MALGNGKLETASTLIELGADIHIPTAAVSAANNIIFITALSFM